MHQEDKTPFPLFEELGVPEKPNWFVENFIPDKGIIILAGPPGSLKTFISEEIVSAAVNNRYLFNEGGFKVNCNGPILLMDLENNFSTIYERLKLLGDVPEGKLYMFNPSLRFDLCDEENQGSIVFFVERLRPSLIIFDTFRRAFSGNENDSAVTNQLYNEVLAKISQICPVLLLVHTRKMSNNKFQVTDKLSEIRGTGDITGISDAVYLINKHKLEESVTVTPLKLRISKLPQPFKVTLLEEDDKLFFQFDGQSQDIVADISGATDDVANWLEENYSPGDEVKTKNIAESHSKLGYKERHMYNVIENLLALKILERKKRGVYVYKQSAVQKTLEGGKV